MKRQAVSGSLYRLIYCSRNILSRPPAGEAPAPDAQQQVHAILDVSRRRNREDNITGALLFTTSGFAQVMEGPREALERAFERINADPRHADVAVLSFTPTERRSFPDWPMGFYGQDARAEADPLAHLLADATVAGPRVTRGSDILRMLETLVKQEDEWLVA